MNRKDTVLVVKEIPPDRDPAARRAAVQEAVEAYLRLRLSEPSGFGKQTDQKEEGTR